MGRRLFTFLFLPLCFVFFANTSQAAEKNRELWSGFPKIDERGNLGESFSARGMQLTIESLRSRYQNSNEIVLDMRLSNQGYYPITFYLNQNYLKNFTVVVRDEQGKSLPAQDIIYQKNLSDYKDPFFQNYTATNYEARSLVLQPGESIVRPIRLHDIVNLNESEEKSKLQLQKLTVSAYFYPNPEQSPQLFLPSQNNFLLLLHKDRTKDNLQIPAPALEPLRVSPFETVFLTLAAEKTETWQNFFKYISLKDLIRDYPDYARDYMQAQGGQKNSVLKAFQEFLMDRQRHKLLNFQVLSQKEDDRTATVKVQAQRNVMGFRREFSYTYYLTKVDKFWLITGVQSQLID